MMACQVFLHYGFIIVPIIAITVQLDHVSASSINRIQISKVQEDSQYVPIVNITDELISKPFSDVHHRSKRYVLQSFHFKSNHLTYRVSLYSDKLRKTDVDLALARAFNLWTTYTYLTFTSKDSGPVHINIKFLKSDQFDGPGGILGIAPLSKYGFDIYFDDDENWTFDSPYGINLFYAALHEIGHTLGLDHSKLPNAIMAPYLNPEKLDAQLDFDDIAAIQVLYGIKAKPEKGSDKLCKDIKIDAIFNSNFGRTIIFKDEFYFLRNDTSLDDDYVRFISQGWPELPENIDAAFLHKSGKTFFFKGDKYWRYTGRLIDVGFPKNISENFKGVPGNLDAALYRKNENEAYFFKNQFYWIYSFSTGIASDAKSIADLGLPNNLNAAFEHKNGHAYFFKNEIYYRISNISTHASDMHPVTFSTRHYLSCIVASDKKETGFLFSIKNFFKNFFKNYF